MTGSATATAMVTSTNQPAQIRGVNADETKGKKHHDHPDHTRAHTAGAPDENTQYERALTLSYLLLQQPTTQTHTHAHTHTLSMAIK